VSENLSEKERADLAEKLKIWREQIRSAIIDYEQVEVTPENVIEEIKTGENTRLIPLSQVRPYLVVGRSRRHDFGPRFARRPIRLAAFPPPFFCDAALA
jgi:hypothetical protein